MTDRPIRRRRWLSLVGAGVIAALTLSSCLVLPFVNSGATDGPGGQTGGPAAPATPITTPPPDKPELAPFYSQKLTWRSCSGGECATMSVPLDYAKPDGAKLSIKLLRVRAKTASARIGSLVVNPGGPGGSGTEYASYADQIVGLSLIHISEPTRPY